MYLKEEVEVHLITKDKIISTLSDLYLELEVVGDLNYSSDPEESAFPKIEINSFSMYLQSFHNLKYIESIQVQNFSVDITVRSINFDKTIEEFEFNDLPSLNSSHILLSKGKSIIKFERKRA